jgi:hypothetical protein
MDQAKTKLYTFIGCAHAVQFYADNSTAPDKAAAQAAAGNLVAVSYSLLAAVGQGKTEEEFKEICGDHVSGVIESIEALKATSVAASMSETLNGLLDYFYTAADGLMGGGGVCAHCGCSPCTSVSLFK